MTASRRLALLGLLVLAGCDPDGAAVDAGPAADAGSPDPSASVDAGSAPDAGPATDAGAPDGGPGDAGRPLEGFGGPCAEGSDCESGMCLPVDPSGFCTRECDPDRPHDCRAEQTLCQRIAGGAACFGPTIDVGPDRDEANLQLGDCVSRTLNPLGADADLFQVRANTDDPIVIEVSPDVGVDVELELYDGASALIARIDDLEEGGREGLQINSWERSSVVHVLVRDAGSSIANPYRICVTPAP